MRRATTLSVTLLVVCVALANAATPRGNTKIRRKGSYRFNGYIRVAYNGREVARSAHLVVSGTFVTRSKTTGTFHLYEPGCKAMKFALTAY